MFKAMQKHPHNGVYTCHQKEIKLFKIGCVSLFYTILSHPSLSEARM